MKSFKEFADNIPGEKPQKKQSGSFQGDWDHSQSMELARETISHAGLRVMRESDKGGDYYFHLKECAFDSKHTNNDAAVIVKSDGTVCYHCFHNSCQDNTWSTLRERFYPKPERQQPEIKRLPKKQKKEVPKILDLVYDLYDNGLETGLSTGWPSLDNNYTIMPGQWTIVTGIPSHGKSAFLDALLVNLTKSDDFKTAVFSPENHPIQLHCSKLIEAYTGFPFYNSAFSAKMDRPTLETGAEFINNHFKFITYGDEILTLDSILQSAQELVYSSGINGLVIDPWNEINHNMEGESETAYISKALTKVRVFARKNNVHVWVVAHPTKLQKNASGDYDPPTPYDIAGSAHFRNKADCAITVHRPKFAPKNFDVDVHVQKIRFKHVGRVGKVGFTFNITNNQYSERTDFI